jgi:ketosteroid isomerase-like protein
MYKWLAKKLVRRTLRFHLNRDVEGVLSTYADDVHFTFHGNNSWAGDYHGKDQMRPWLERFHAIGLNLRVHEILVSGPPWNTTVCLYITDDAKDADGNVIYENRGVIYGKGAWGKMKRYEVFEDTEKVAELDKYLAKHEAALTGK